MSASSDLPVRRRLVARLVISLALAVASGCGPNDEDKEPAKTIRPPSCDKVLAFGNGRTCSSDDPALAACGTKKSRLCANGWLCFDSPEIAFCGCETDADCAARAQYINTARAVRKIAPLGAKCVAGRCAGAP